MAGAAAPFDAGRGGGRHCPQTALKDLAVRLRRQGLVILLSDLLADPDGTRTALRYLRHQGHEVLVFHLMDPGERELPAASAARFFDPETGQELQVTWPTCARSTAPPCPGPCKSGERSTKPHGVDYVVLNTDEPLSRPLRAYLRKRERLG